MKKLVLLSTFLTLAAVALSAQTTTKTWTANWTNSSSVYTGPTNVTFAPGGNVFYWQTNVTLPFNQWMYLTNTPDNQVSGQNYVAITNWSGTITIPSGANVFATIQYTNSAGASPLSNLAGAASAANPAALSTFRLQ